jgi:cytosine/adenosine deaminase-related metal-dependent hydrolase
MGAAKHKNDKAGAAVVTCPGSNFVLALRLANDFLHDGVTVTVFAGKRQ